MRNVWAKAAYRFTMVTGKFAITDYFDNNSYSRDPRRQFMNWSLMSNGAWDYPADTRGYTIGTMQEFSMQTWSLRAATVLEPTEANGPTFDTRVAKNRGEAVEWEQRYAPLHHCGAFRVLGFLNRERAGTWNRNSRPTSAYSRAMAGPTARRSPGLSRKSTARRAASP